MKNIVLFLTVLSILSCNTTRYPEDGGREVFRITDRQKRTAEGSRTDNAVTSQLPCAERRDSTLSYTPKFHFDYLEKDRDGIFFGNIYKIKQKKNRIVLKRQSIAKIAGFELHE